MLAVGAQIGKKTVGHGEEALAFAGYLAAAAKDINYAAANIYPIGGVDPCKAKGEAAGKDFSQCAGFYVNFESDMPQIEYRVVRVVVAALPTQEARDFLNDLSKGSLLSALWNSVEAFRDVATGLHWGAAPYRSGLETVVANDVCKSGVSKAASEDALTVWIATECLGLPHDSFFAGEDEIAPTEFKKVDVGSLHAVLRIAQTACAGLPFSKEDEDQADALGKKVVFQPEKRPTAVK